MSEPVLADAQFGILKILRPYTGFDSAASNSSYEGVTGTTPIMFTENGEPLDKQAGTPGYSPSLLKGLAVPYGARVTVWLPQILGLLVSPPLYDWFFIWRARNVFDYRQQRVPYHYPKQAAGAAAAGSPRVVIPAALHAVVYNQAEPVGGGGFAFQHSYGESIEVHPVGIVNPRVPTTGAVVLAEFEQGLIDPGVYAAGTKPLYQMFEIQAMGDELLIGVQKTSAAAWGFNAAETDEIFARLFGHGGTSNTGPFVDVGVYVSVGAAP